MSSRKRAREAFQEHSYWQSYSDMMAALLLFFVLITAVTMTVYRKKTTDLEVTQRELNLAREKMQLVMADLEQSNQELTLSLEQLQQAYDQEALTQEALQRAYMEIEASRAELALTRGELQNIVGIRTDIIRSLQSIFNKSSMKVDAQTGSITFSSDVLFRYNSATLTSQSQEALRQVIPMYLSVLLQEQYRDYIAEIIIEGHTDTDGTYQSNMELSYNRAYAVAGFCLKEKNGLNQQQIGQLQELLTVNGRSYSDPVYLNNSDKIDMAASRRVEIKFRLKEDEMINKITEIINRE